MQLIAQVVGQFDLHRPLNQPLGQLGEKPTRPDDLILGLGTGQQLVDDFVGQDTAQVVGHLLKDPSRGSRLPS